MTVAFNRQTFALLLGILFFLPRIVNAQAFSYGGAKCAGDGTFAPLPPALPPGGTFSGPGGLSIDPATGVIDAALSAPGFYSVLYGGSGCNCTYMATVSIMPKPNFTIINNTVCPGATNVMLTASPASGLTFTWLPVGTNGHTLNIPVTSPIKTFTIIGSNSAGCKTQVVTGFTVMGTTPLVVSGPATLCAGNAATLTASGANKFLWSTGAITKSIIVTPANTTTYVVHNNDAPTCNIRKNFVIVVSQKPLLSAPSLSACAGTTVVLRAAAVPSTNVTYMWQPGGYPGDSLLYQTDNNSETFTVSATRAGCAATMQVRLSVFSSTPAVLGFTYKYPICIGGVDSLPVVAPGFSEGGSFSSNPSLPMDTATGRLDLPNLLPGVYQVTYKLKQEGCKLGGERKEFVVVNAPVDLQVTGDTTINVDAQAVLHVSGGTEYLWTPADYLSCTKCPNPVTTPPSSLRYCVASIVEGCYSEKCFDVKVECKNGGDLSLPTAFTPNNDSKNDLYCLRGWTGCNTGFQISIFDRWGNEVFTSDDPSFCWDGIYNGQLLPAGMYAYVVNASFNRIPFTRSGNISLIR